MSFAQIQKSSAVLLGENVLLDVTYRQYFDENEAKIPIIYQY